MRFLLLLMLAAIGFLGWAWQQEKQKVVALEARIQVLERELREANGEGGGGKGKRSKDWRTTRETRWKTPQQAADGPVKGLDQMSPEERKTFGK